MRGIVDARVGHGLQAWRQRLARRRQQRSAHVAEASRHSLDHLLQLHRSVAQTLALRLDVQLEVVDVGEQEVAASEERLHLVLSGDLLVLDGAARLETSIVDRLGGHGARRVEHTSGFVARLAQQPVGLDARLGHRLVGGALGEQQRATDDLGVAAARRCRCCGRTRCHLLRHFLQLGHGGAGAGLHRGGLVLGELDRAGDLFLEGVDLVGVVAPLDDLEAGAAHRVWAHLHGDQFPYPVLS